MWLQLLAGAVALVSADAPVAPSVIPPASASSVPAGTPVRVSLMEPISSRSAKRGDKFAIRLAAPVVLGERIVVPAGVAGVGEIVDAAPAGALGRSGKLILAARYLEVGGARIPLRSLRLAAAGDDKTVDVAGGMAIAVAITPVGLLAGFIKGGEIEIPAGTIADAKLAAAVDPALVGHPAVAVSP